MKFIYSLRFKLILIFIVSILTPVIMITLVFISFYRQQTLKESHMLINNTLTSISQNISSYLYELQNLSMMPCFDNTIKSALEHKNSLYGVNLAFERVQSTSLPIYLNNSSHVLSIVILDNDGQVLYANRNCNVRLINNYPFFNQEWYKEVIKKEGHTLFIGSRPPRYFTLSAPSRVFSVARAFREPYFRNKTVVILVDADAVIFHEILSSLKFGGASASLILDETGQVIYSTRPVSINILKQLRQKASYIKDNRRAYNVFSETIIPSNWKVAVLVSDSELQKELKWIYHFSLSFVLLVITLTFFIFIVLSKHIVSSFREMIAVMKQVKLGNLDVKCSVKGNDEIAALKNSLNSMITQLNDLIIKEYRLVLSQRNAEYKALQSQIQPHFLYNTLNMLIGFNRLGERETLEKSIFNLTGMMRYTLENEDMATVGQEFDFLKKYCELQKLRFENRINITIAYSPAVKDFKIPKLILQPLVENSFLYAVEPAALSSNISITAAEVNEGNYSFVSIRIDDDGPGYDPDKISGKKGIGITNVQERLKLTYPDSVFIIESAPFCGTHIHIKIPFNGEA